jgi:hypothetical protein
MEQEGQRIRLPKLATDGSNWVVYRDRVIWAMQVHTIDEHISDDTPPQAYLDHGTVDSLTPQARWDKEENIIKQILCSTLPDTAFNRIKSATTIKAVWEILKRVYEDRSKALVADVIRRFRNRRCEETESVRTHFEALADLREQLAAMGKAVDDADYTDTLLASLPASYDSTISSISASAKLGSKTLTAEIFEQLITDEYERRQVKDKRVEPKDEALSADFSKKGGKGKSKDKKNVECYNCRKKGHYKSECWKKGGGDEGGGPQRGKGSKEGTQDGAAPAEEKQEPEAWALIEDMQEPADEQTPDAAAAAAGSTPAQAEQARSGIATELYDSGASRHMSPFRDRFVSYKTIPPRAITAADKRVFYAIGTGDLEIEVPNGESSTRIILKDVLHAPDMGTTIISVNRITKAGYSVTFKDNACQIRNKEDKIIGSIPASQNGLYKVERVFAAATPEEHIDLATLHRCLAHIAPDAIRRMVKNHAFEGIDLVDDGSTLICETCEQAKATRKQINKEREAPLADAFGDEVHTDLWGPSPVPSLGGRAYYVTFIDDYSRFTKLTILRSKDQTLDAYKSFAAWAHTQKGVKIKRLRSDRGGEYTGNAFTKFLEEQGTERRLTTHDTPQHNGVAESLNRRLVERIRAFLIQSGLPKFLWAEAARFVVWLRNRTTTKVLGNMTPYERLTGQKPNLAGVPEWGQRVWVHDDSGTKLDGRASEARWVGYDEDSTHAHRVYLPDTHRVSVERNVRFTAQAVTVSMPTSKPPQPVAPPSQSQKSVPQPPPATSSGEEEVEVEDELEDQTPPTSAAPTCLSQA